MIKLIAMDMDGTLLNHRGMITAETLSALEKAHQQGIQLALCSGRPYESAEAIIRKLNLKEKQGFYIGMNGQFIHSFKTNETIELSQLSQIQIQTIIKRAENLPLIATLYEKTNCLLCASRRFMWLVHLFSAVQNLLWIFRQNDNYEKTIFFTFDKLKLESTGKICFCGLPATLKKLERQLSSEFSCVYVSSFWMECQPQGISKGNALHLIAERIKIETDAILAFGDGENDISMLQAAGTKVAMENAMPRVKEIADDICPSNQKNGIAVYLKQHVLTEQSQSL